MSQLGLNLTERLPYDAKGFVMHSGVEEALLDAIAASKGDNFASRFYFGPARSGKTHLSVKVGEEISNISGCIPRIIEASELSSFFSGALLSITLSKFDAFIIDDFHLYVDKIYPGDSGPFVSFYEAVRRAGGKLYLFSGVRAEDFHVDAHIMSRLNASLAPELVHPREEEIPTLISSLANQRGIRLKSKKLDFVSKRVPRDIQGIENYLSRVLHLSKLFGTKIKFPLLNDAI